MVSPHIRERKKIHQLASPALQEVKTAAGKTANSSATKAAV
jgi:hypothetical protein